MQFTNSTAARAAFLSTTFGAHHMLGGVIARPAFRIDQEELLPAEDVEWPVGGIPAQTPYGYFPADMPFLTGGIDVIVIGSVWQPGARPGPELTAEIRIGERVLRRITVLGDRRWVRQDGVLVPGAPEPFVSMPLAYERAFGGALENENVPFAWPPNPQGSGFYLTPEQAEGQVLPNLEDPDHRIASIEDRPDPMATGPYPEQGSLRAQHSVELDLESANPGLKRISPLVFNRAHPKMILRPSDAPLPGVMVEVTHACAEGALRFRMPELAFHARVDLEHRSHVFPLHLDQIAVLLDERRVVLGYRVAFKYRLVKGERRTVVLQQRPIPEGERGSSHQE